MKSNSNLLAGIVALSALTCASSAFAYAAPRLGTAASFTVLSTEDGSRGAVTCTDSSLVGNIGSSGMPAAVVLTRCAHTGSVVAPVTRRVLADFNAAYTQAAANACGTILTGTQAGAILAPGVYCFDAAAALTGTMTLNGPSTGVWIFLVNGDLTGNTFTVKMAGGGKACNVYWAPSGATTMTTSNAKGTILAQQAITLTGGSFTGRAFAGKAVTLTTVAATGCATTSRF